MKRILCLILALLVLALCACRAENTEIKIGESELYTREEIMAAAKVVVNAYNGSEDLTLLRVEYDEDLTLREMESRKKHYGDETVIVLRGDIYVGVNAMAVGAFVPGRTSTDYQFILTRDNFGRWTIRDSGYA